MTGTCRRVEELNDTFECWPVEHVPRVWWVVPLHLQNNVQQCVFLALRGVLQIVRHGFLRVEPGAIHRRSVLQDATRKRKIFRVCPELTVSACVDDMTFHMRGFSFSVGTSVNDVFHKLQKPMNKFDL